MRFDILESFYSRKLLIGCLWLYEFLRLSSHLGVLRNFAKFTRNNHLYQRLQRLFVNKVSGLMPATLLKERLWHRCFLMNFDEKSKITVPFLQNTSEQLLLYVRVHVKTIPWKFLILNNSRVIYPWIQFRKTHRFLWI